jgi:shikimate kinase
VKRHIVLVGLPGAGKTTVGRLAAERLQAAFVDIDAVLVRREGKPIAMLFAERGEAAFRELERKEMDATLAGAPAVVASGGGWAAQPGAVAGATAQALIVYLRARPETAAQRAAPEGTRPLLIGEDPVDRMRQLSRERERAYSQADATLDTDRQPPERLAAEVVRLAQSRAGW